MLKIGVMKGVVAPASVRDSHSPRTEEKIFIDFPVHKMFMISSWMPPHLL
jgi:hypothetical protein